MRDLILVVGAVGLVGMGFVFNNSASAQPQVEPERGVLVARGEYNPTPAVALAQPQGHAAGGGCGDPGCGAAAGGGCGGGGGCGAAAPSGGGCGGH